ncbi:MAG: hypothetical protein CSA58_11780 [Micrococcales bacterium]|nr:MAG: hypothetical protein CSB46_02355 [Micrococcales bacterium]PIE26012.1 MAG: hypothetical protein CSA58_11780 [Micrococcales bacterium]
MTTVLVLLASVGAVLLVVRENPEGGPGRTTGSTPAAEDVIRAYFDALNTGDASAALALAYEPPRDKGPFLTDDALRAATRNSQFTDVTITPPDGPHGVRYTVSYSFGERRVDSILSLRRGPDDGFLIKDAVTRVDIAVQPTLAAGLSINGQPVSTNTIYVFPGSYQLRTEDDRYALEDERLELAELTATHSLRSGLVLSDTGRAAVEQTAKAKAARCAAQHELQWSSCGISVDPELVKPMGPLAAKPLQCSATEVGTDWIKAVDFDVQPGNHHLVTADIDSRLHCAVIAQNGDAAGTIVYWFRITADLRDPETVTVNIS